MAGPVAWYIMGQSIAHADDQDDGQACFQREHRDADQHVAVARDVDQRGLADRGHGRDDLGGEQEGERRGAGDEGRSDQAHYRLAWNCQGERDAELRADHPEADLPHLLGDRFLVAVLQLLRRSPVRGSGRSWS